MTNPRRRKDDIEPAVTESRGTLVYQPQQIEAQYSVFGKSGPSTRWQVIRRFLTLVQFLLKLTFYIWYDGQIWTYVGEEDIDRAQSIRRRLHARWLTEQLLIFGPTFIKVDQSLSTRVDLIRKEYIEELSKLQDRVPPFPVEQVRQIISAELGKAPEALFEFFDPTPMAAASLGQVHRARLADGQEVVVKVQRPNLIETFKLDLSIIRKIAKLLQANTELGRGREWVQIVDEFGKTLFEEIDYIQEGRNADSFRKYFVEDPGIQIPQIHWRYTSRRVITMEYLPGIKINDLHGIETRELNREKLATHCVKAYFQQILVHGFYHADPHPGNIAVKDDGTIIFYDFGMVGRISEETRIQIVETFLNIINKKPDHILNNLLALGMIGENADLEVIRQVIAWSLDNYYDVPHDALNFEQIAEEMAELMYAHPFKLPASFTFLIRAMITLEGIATTLYPPVEFMGIAVDYARQFLGQSLSLEVLVRKGLDFLSVGSHKFLKTPTTQRVRLQHDEWTPLARYIKAGFLMLGLGQLLLMFLWMVSWAVWLPPSAKQPASLVWLMLGFFVLVFYGIVQLLVIVGMPARKKPMRFEPILPKKG